MSIDCFRKQPLNGWLVGQTRFTPSFLRRGTGGDRNPRRQGKVETVPNTYCHHVCIKVGTGGDRNPRRQGKVETVPNTYCHHVCIKVGTGGDRNPRRQGKVETVPNTYCYHVCIKVGSNRSHLNVSLIVRGKVKRQCPYPQLFEKRAELNQGPSAYQPNALPRGQTGSQPPLNKHSAIYSGTHTYTAHARNKLILHFRPAVLSS